ncbi:hypothetical protein [Emticicia sp.]|uniref:hypothetical protein n=1 Tax=Emticicia sp. TaxID=1930953 RepID=UPI0037509A34
MDTFIKILKFIFRAIWAVFIFSVKTIFTIAGIILRNTQKSDKGFYKEVEEKGNYTGMYD